MCNILLSSKMNNAELEFIVYNIAFAETSGRFTSEFIHSQLLNYEIEAEKHVLEVFFKKWLDLGLIFDNAEEYIINT